MLEFDEIDTIMKCPNCGHEVADDSLFCELCGAQIAKKKKSHKALWITLVVLILVGLIGGVVYHQNKVQQRQMAEANRLAESERLAREEAERKAAEFEEAKKEAEKRAKAAEKKNKESKTSKEWIDLGLPSGTLWKKNNEDGYYTYDEVKKKFGKNLPSIDQFVELTEYCDQWWTGDGYQFVGNNGQSIFIKAAGFKENNDRTEIEEYGSSIYCYTSDAWWIEGSEPTEYLTLFQFSNGYRNWIPSSPMMGHSVHLVRKR